MRAVRRGRARLRRRPSRRSVSLPGNTLMKWARGMPHLFTTTSRICARCWRTSSTWPRSVSHSFSTTLAVKRMPSSSFGDRFLRLEVGLRACSLPSRTPCASCRTAAQMTANFSSAAPSAARAARPIAGRAAVGRRRSSSSSSTPRRRPRRRRRRLGAASFGVDQAVDDFVDLDLVLLDLVGAARGSRRSSSGRRRSPGSCPSGRPRCAWRSRSRLRASAARPSPSRACTCAPGRWCGRIRSRRVDSAASAASSASSSAGDGGDVVGQQQRFGVGRLLVDRRCPCR